LTKLPRVAGRECVAALVRAGFFVRRQQSSHIVLRRAEPFSQVVVPDHRELDRGTLRSILRQASLTVDEFIELLG
jgi:predicted RNA binding protein YcfA (HicA-like mRNA interferase family)